MARTRAGEYLRGRRDVRSLGPTITRHTEDRSLLADLRDGWRMIGAWRGGDYRGVQGRSVVAAVVAVAYFLSPIDLIPDVFVGLGLVDDLTVVALALRTWREEVDRFRRWRAAAPDAPDARVP